MTLRMLIFSFLRERYFFESCDFYLQNITHLFLARAACLFLGDSNVFNIMNLCNLHNYLFIKAHIKRESREEKSASEESVFFRFFFLSMVRHRNEVVDSFLGRSQSMMYLLPPFILYSLLYILGK